jgi:hypothetical protein
VQVTFSRSPAAGDQVRITAREEFTAGLTRYAVNMALERAVLGALADCRLRNWRVVDTSEMRRDGRGYFRTWVARPGANRPLAPYVAPYPDPSDAGLPTDDEERPPTYRGGDSDCDDPDCDCSYDY